MSDASETAPMTRRYRRSRFERNPHIPKIPLGPTRDPDKRQLPEDHPDGDHADQFSALYPEEIEQETRNVRFDMTFTDSIKVREQAELIISIMEEIIGKTRQYRLGDLERRMQSHDVANRGRRVLARMNGKQPHGDTYKKPAKT